MRPQYEEAIRVVAKHVAEFGWHCLHVHPNTDAQLPFSYSIGFAESFGQPEILVFNQPREKAHSLLSVCANMFRSGEKIESYQEDGRVLEGAYKVIFRPVALHAYGEFLGTAKRYYGGKPFSAVVMFLPDKNHRYPWDEGYDYLDLREALAIVE